MVSEGNPAPDFTLHTADDQPDSLTAFRGRPVLLVFLRHLG
jgi:peroxiredoxin